MRSVRQRQRRALQQASFDAQYAEVVGRRRASAQEAREASARQAAAHARSLRQEEADAAVAGAAAAASFSLAVLTEIYLCGVCSCE
jgi:phosphotransacetylase